MKVSRIHIEFILFFIFCFFPTKNIKASIILLDGNIEMINLSPKVQYWGDTTFTAHIEKVLKIDKTNFKSNQGNYFLFPYVNACPWVNFQLVNIDTQRLNFYLNVDNYRISEADLYIYNNGRLVNQISTGERYDFNQRPVEHIDFLFPISIASNDTLDCYLRLFRSSNLVFSNLKLETSEHFIGRSATKNYKLGIFIGIALFFVIIAFVSLLLFRRRLLFFYFLMVLAMFIFCLMREGTGHQYLFGNSGIWIKWIYFFGVPILQLFAIVMFGITYFKTARSFPKMHLWFMRVGFFMLILVGLGVFLLVALSGKVQMFKLVSYNLILLLQFTILFTFILLTALGIQAYIKKKNIESLAYITVIGVYLFFAISMFLQSRGVVLQGSILKFSIFTGFIFEMIVLTFLVVRNYRNNLREKEKLEIANNRNQIKIANALLQGEELERRRIASDLHDSIGSILSISKLYLSQVTLDNKSTLENWIDKAHAETRRLSNALMPKSLFTLGLVSAIEDLCELLKKSNTIKISFIKNELIFQYSDFQKINIYRLINELLEKILKETQPKNITIHLTEFENELNLIIESDGKTEVAFLQKSKTIQTRIEALKGIFHVDFNIRSGTSVVMDFTLI